MDSEFVKSLESCTLEKARETSIEVVKERQAKTINQKTARAQIIRDLEHAPNLNEIIRIMYQQLLASEGIRTVGSAWRSKYDNI